jgi:ABC-type glycerol-3-phosphate transport system permease component
MPSFDMENGRTVKIAGLIFAFISYLFPHRVYIVPVYLAGRPELYLINQWWLA